ncbi:MULTISPECIES: OsmC family protein [unclassified Streptomyces]|uniref:OsmC family protein n=1 Tax=unclassified Streptomyces TaxID=2593676 RepID=UPI002236FCF4|nr:OsmC family protein [Streptomyces sp. SHP 1-2]MCW5253514.1 OsmC family protein [Streptomyces sp. SHP 1-2]
MSDDIVQSIEVSVRPAPGRTKMVRLPLAGEVPMGMRDEISAHYRVDSADVAPNATTLDYLVGAAAGCLTGTLGGMLGALGQPVLDGALTTSARGTVVRDGGVLRISAIHVRYELERAPDVSVEDIEKVHDRHHRHCPIARSIGGSIELTSEITVL